MAEKQNKNESYQNKITARNIHNKSLKIVSHALANVQIT